MTASRRASTAPGSDACRAGAQVTTWWRYWRLEDDRLASPYIRLNDPWPDGREQWMSCREHDAPAPRCLCGMYATSSTWWLNTAITRAVREGVPTLFARVELLGATAPDPIFKLGIRAAGVRFTELWTPEFLPTDLERTLRARYAIVHVGSVNNAIQHVSKVPNA